MTSSLKLFKEGFIMKVSLFCYYFEDQNGFRKVPFLEYMQKYSPKPTDSQQELKKKAKKIENIKTHLRNLLEKQGRYHEPPYVKEYTNELGILKIKEGKTLVRITFYTHVTLEERKIVLLSVFEKPSLYEKSKKRKVDKEVQKALDDAEYYRDDYLQTGNAKMLSLKEVV